MRKKDNTLRGTLLDFAREIADTGGIDAINIRALAKKANVATGTVYNYFTSKDEILLALTEEYWQQTLIEMRTIITSDSFCEQLEEIFIFLQARIQTSAGKLMGSLGNIETEGHARMTSMQSELEASLIQRMEQDKAIRRDIWNEAFTKEQFVRFLMMNLMMLLKAQASDITFLITLIKRSIY